MFPKRTGKNLAVSVEESQGMGNEDRKDAHALGTNREHKRKSQVALWPNTTQKKDMEGMMGLKKNAALEGTYVALDYEKDNTLWQAYPLHQLQSPPPSTYR